MFAKRAFHGIELSRFEFVLFELFCFSMRRSVKGLVFILWNGNYYENMFEISGG